MFRAALCLAEAGGCPVEREGTRLQHTRKGEEEGGRTTLSKRERGGDGVALAAAAPWQRVTAFTRLPSCHLLVDGATRARARLPRTASRPAVDGLTLSTHYLAVSAPH
eukprot:8944658-Pyramimonas_sp.AAC.1